MDKKLNSSNNILFVNLIFEVLGLVLSKCNLGGFKGEILTHEVFIGIFSFCITLTLMCNSWRKYISLCFTISYKNGFDGGLNQICLWASLIS